MVQGREPFQRNLSQNVQILFGFKNAHAVVKVRLPGIGIWYPVEITAEHILKFKRNFDDAFQYGSRPAQDRTLKEPVEFYARDDCRGRWGYPDGHVELHVKRLLVWIPLEFPFEEFVLAKKAMDEAHLWASLPEEVRAMQGAS